MQLNHDQPLAKANALQPGMDKLGRRGFAESVVQALAHVNQHRGLVLSIEGKWGSGKTSTLAMVEALFELEPSKPLVVHFNPWLVGDRDALLGQFLSQVGKAAKLSEYAKDGKRVAKEIEAYSKAFDVVKLIPGAEPWATIIKSVFTSVGSATGAIADYKAPDLQSRKKSVEDALRKLPQPIIVVVDDVDRLFPKEVFEVVRIIKAVGDLPNIGYVLAWDAEYVEAALKSADVAAADVYLDKIVQVRMNLPVLSNPARARLFNDAFNKLHDDARKSYFSDDQELLSQLYQSGLRQLLEQPRDIARLFNNVQITEPKLRGNVVLADQIGWAALSLYAPSVAKLVRSEFDVSHNLIDALWDQLAGDDSKDTVFQSNLEKRRMAISQCRNSDAVSSIAKFLFPNWAARSRTQSFIKFRDDEGRISHENRFRVVAQWGASAAEVDLLKAQQFILEPSKRDDLIVALDEENCLDFLEAVSGLSMIASNMDDSFKSDLLLALARVLDRRPYAMFTKNNYWSIERTQLLVWRVISEVIGNIHKGHGEVVAERIVADSAALSMAATLLDPHWIDNDPSSLKTVMINECNRRDLLNAFGRNVISATKDAQFWDLALPGKILRVLTLCSSDIPSLVFSNIIKIDPNLDQFAQTLLLAGRSSDGEYYELNEKDHRVLYSNLFLLDELKAHAEKRLADSSLGNPVRAAWLAVSTGKKIFENGRMVD